MVISCKLVFEGSFNLFSIVIFVYFILNKVLNILWKISNFFLPWFGWRPPSHKWLYYIWTPPITQANSGMLQESQAGNAQRNISRFDTTKHFCVGGTLTNYTYTAFIWDKWAKQFNKQTFNNCFTLDIYFFIYFST